jgi:hypothetical protein
MPDSRSHRGPHPEDAILFAPSAWPALREATADLCWLLSREYATPSALKLVGDRHQLTGRQRAAVERCACADADRRRRDSRRAAAPELAGRPLRLDGYNVLTTIEVALGGGVLLAACDGTIRDIASMHGTYRKVAETMPALELLGGMAGALQTGTWFWYFDRPVSNSGRLRKIMETLAAERGWPWQVELVPSPDAVLAESADIIATADSAVLDRCRQWFNLAREVIERRVPNATVVPLGTAPDPRKPGSQAAS